MKTGILITARLKSTRLPRKVVKEISGKPMLVHLIDRLKLAKLADVIVLCTSTFADDDPLIALAEKENIGSFRGHPDDVLLRLTQAAGYFNLDTVINCTADNPFVDPEYIDYLLTFHWENEYDFSKVEGLPFGTFSYALSYQAMVKACDIKDKVDTEVWGGYFTETGLFSWGIFTVRDQSVFWPSLRLTVDTPEDFQLVNEIFSELYEPDVVFSLAEIVNLCRKRPDLVSINSEINQKIPEDISIKRNLDE